MRGRCLVMHEDAAGFVQAAAGNNSLAAARRATTSRLVEVAPVGVDRIFSLFVGPVAHYTMAASAALSAIGWTIKRSDIGGGIRMAKASSFNFAIDHDHNLLLLTAIGDDGHDVVAEMEIADIAKLMATLSQCQQGLVLSQAGTEVSLPLDPNIGFEPDAGGYVLGAFEAHWRHALGIDTEVGAVHLKLLSRTGRLTSIALSADAARHLGNQLLRLADRVPHPQRRQ